MGGKENLSKMILFSILGMIVIFIFGVLYFSFIMHNVVGTPMGLSEILMVAVVPFLIKDFVFAVLTVLFARTLTKRGLVLQ